ncbi:cell morphogenesis N-terminal-domain-containing protein [Zopfochytrium polystomum]|nr:cell morphogenesis N-terminal-domain-containing protein [Zopfochytrium polystomum]
MKGGSVDGTGGAAPVVAAPNGAAAATAGHRVGGITSQPYVLQGIFSRFVFAAEHKLISTVYAVRHNSTEPTVDLASPLRPDIDPEFDGLLSGLGSVARHCPKLVIDGVMTWRKAKGELNAAEEIPANMMAVFGKKDMEPIIRERKALIANFILCRVLIEVASRLTKETLPDELGSKLEDMVFGQLRNTDPELAFRSANRYANMDFFAQFLGVLSNLRFAKIADRFVKEINEVMDSNAPVTIKELKTELLIRCMRHLKLKIYPQDALDETATFLQIFAGKFHDSHNARVKHAYAEVFVELLEPIVSVASTEVNLQGWMEAIEKIFVKASRMVQKKGHVQVALPLVTTILCVSRKDFFLKNWPPIVELSIQRLRDRNLRNMALISITRLLWVYLFRSSDSAPANTSRRIEALLRILYPPRLKVLNPDGVPLDLFVRLSYILLVHAPESAIELLIPLLQGMDSSPSTAVMSAPAAGLRPASPFGNSVNTMGFGTSSTATGGTLVSSGPDYKLFTDDHTLTSFSGGGIPNTNVLFLSPAFNSLSSEGSFSPERMIVALRSFLLFLSDVEGAIAVNSGMGAFGGPLASSMVVVQGKLKIQPPPFPALEMLVDGDMTSLSMIKERKPINMPSSGPADNAWGNWSANVVEDQTSAPSSSINDALPDHVFNSFTVGLKSGVEKMNHILGRLFTLLDLPYGHHYWQSSSSGNSGTSGIYSANQTDNSAGASKDYGSPATGRRPSVGDLTAASATDLHKADKRTTVDDGTVPSKDRSIIYELLRNCVECVPRLSPKGIPATKVVEMLCRYCFHADDGVRKAAVSAIIRIAKTRSSDPDQGYWHLGGRFRPGKSLLEGTLRIIADVTANVYYERIGDAPFVAEFSVANGPNNLQHLYLQLLEDWLKDTVNVLNDKTINPVVKGFEMESARKFLDELDGVGLLHLCSTSHVVRTFGVHLITRTREYSSSLTEDDTNVNEARILTVMEDRGYDLISKHYLEPPTIQGVTSMEFEHQKLKQQHQQNLLRLLATKESLIKLACSESASEMAIWNRCLPDLFKFIYKGTKRRSVDFCLNDVMSRLIMLNPAISQIADPLPSKALTNASKWGTPSALSSGALVGTPPAPLTHATEQILNQWKVYLTFACVSVIPGTSDADTHKDSDEKPVDFPISPRFNLSPRALFNITVPYLSCERTVVRKIAVQSLGLVNSKSLDALLEMINPYVNAVLEDIKLKLNSRRSYSVSSAISKRQDRLRVELTSLFAVIVSAPQKAADASISDDIWSLGLTYVRELFRFLSDAEIRGEWDYQMLRYYFCCVVDRFYSVADHNPPIGSNSVGKHFPLELRISIFKLLEQWCGRGRQAVAFLDKQTKAMLAALEPVKDNRDRGILASTMNEQKHALQIAALRAMLSLCHGESFISRKPTDSPRFVYIGDLSLWLFDIFKQQTADDIVQTIGIAALEAIIRNNFSHQLLEVVMKGCYEEDPQSRTAIGFYTALVQAVCGQLTSGKWNLDSEPLADTLPTLLCLALFKLGDENVQIRKLSVSLLESLKLRSPAETWSTPNVREKKLLSELSAASSSLPIIYKNVQLASSIRIAEEDPLFTCEMVCELCHRTRQISTWALAAENNFTRSYVHDMLELLIPWVQNLYLIPGPSHNEMEILPANGLDFENSFFYSDALRSSIWTRIETILTNLFFLTYRFSDKFISEVETIWLHFIEDFETDENSSEEQKVRSEKHIQLVVDYLLSLGARTRNPAFLPCAKRIAVYLGRSSFKHVIVASLAQRITPMSCIPLDLSVNEMGSSEERSALFRFDIDELIPTMPNRPPFCVGSLAGMLLVDLCIEMGTEFLRQHLPHLVHIAVMQLDHHISLICDQMRLLLLNLVYITFADSGIVHKDVDALILKLNLREGRRMWAYEDIRPNGETIHSASQLSDLVREVVAAFNLYDEGIRVEWVKTALKYAVSCPVRHYACRSLQIFRSLNSDVSLRNLGEILYRLSATVSDSSSKEVQGFTLELFQTLQHICSSNDSQFSKIFPQLFWAAIAGLYSPSEWEYIQSANMLELILQRLDLQDKKTVNQLLINLPAKWKGSFIGIQPLLLQGLSSSKAEKVCLKLVKLLLAVDDDSIVDKSSYRALMSVLAFVPRLLQGFESDPSSDGGREIGLTLPECLSVAEQLAKLSQKRAHPSLSRLLQSYAKQRFRTKDDFLQQFAYILKDYFFASSELQAVQILGIMFANSIPFYRKMLLRLFKLVLPHASENLWKMGNSKFLDGVTFLNLEEDIILPLTSLLGSNLNDDARAALDELMKRAVNLSEPTLRHITGGRSINRILKDGWGMPKHPGQPSPENSENQWRARDFQKLAKITRYNLAGVASTCAATLAESSSSSDKVTSSSDASSSKKTSPQQPHPVAPTDTTAEAQVQNEYSPDHKEKLLMELDDLDLFMFSLQGTVEHSSPPMEFLADSQQNVDADSSDAHVHKKRTSVDSNSTDVSYTADMGEMTFTPPLPLYTGDILPEPSALEVDNSL